MTECERCRELYEVLRRVNTEYRVSQTPSAEQAVVEAEFAYYYHLRTSHASENASQVSLPI